MPGGMGMRHWDGIPRLCAAQVYDKSQKNKWLDCCNIIFLSHMMLLGNPQGGAKVARKFVVLICLAMRDQHRDAQAL